MPQSCQAIRLSHLSDVLGRRQLVSLCIGADLNPVLLSIAGKLDYRFFNQLGASFPKLFASRSNRFRIHHRVDGAWAAIDLPATKENYHCVQPLPSGRWLLVRGRAKSVDDKNAHVFEADGRPINSFHAGDGIEDCQATTDGRIWTSFFDEGVYSDVPAGRWGLAAYDMAGETVFTLEECAEQAGDISDCYALNIPDNRNTWLCYYTDFPIVHLRDGKLEGVWESNPIAGSHAFALVEGGILFAGSYDHPESLFRVSLSDMSTEAFEVTAPDGTRLQKFYAVGRGGKLLLNDGKTLYEVDARCF